MTVSLSQDLIFFQILTRIPTKSVVCFKCVSNQWNSFLTSDIWFKEMHNRNHLKDPHLEDQNIFYYSGETAFFTIHCESLPNKAPCQRLLPQFRDCPPQYRRILASFHGLVCLGLNYNTTCARYSDIVLWNPSTTEYKFFSKPANPDHMECYEIIEKGYGLYYSSREDDYKLLVVTYSYNVYIYSLKSDSWRKLNMKLHFQEIYYWRPGLCCKNDIYFLLPYTNGTVIRFDTTTERFHKIETPFGYEYDITTKRYTANITIHGGSIHLCVKYDIRKYDFTCSEQYDFTCIELWKLNADGDIWSKVVTYQLNPENEIRCFYPLHLMSNGNCLMIDYHNGYRILHANFTKKKNAVIKSEGICYDEYILNYSGIRGYPQNVRYTETFVSPNKYMK